MYTKMKFTGIFDGLLNPWMSSSLKVTNVHGASEIIGRKDILGLCQCKYKMHGLNLGKVTTITTCEVKVQSHTILDLLKPCQAFQAHFL